MTRHKTTVRNRDASILVVVFVLLMGGMDGWLVGENISTEQHPVAMTWHIIYHTALPGVACTYRTTSSNFYLPLRDERETMIATAKLAITIMPLKLLYHSIIPSEGFHSSFILYRSNVVLAVNFFSPVCFGNNIHQGQMIS